jgi:protein regulator of cytokinesis 1
MDTSYLAQQVTTIIGQLHGLFDDIGVPSHERDSREAEVSRDGVYARAIADFV